MNVNEVVKNQKYKYSKVFYGWRIKPMMMSIIQSSNDTFPTGMHIAAYKA
jgi:fumarate hydratase class II